MSERLTKFLKTVSDFADEECSTLEAEAQSFKDENVDKYRKEATTKNREYIEYETSRIKSDVNCKISSYESDKKSELTNLRNELTEKVFNDVKEKINLFTLSNEYYDFIIKSCKDVKDAIGNDLIIFLRADDMKYADKIKAETGLTVKEDKSILYGGIKASDKDLTVTADDTIDSRLLLQKKKFTENSNLAIV